MQWQNCFRCRSGRAFVACRRRVVCGGLRSRFSDRPPSFHGGLALIEMDVGRLWRAVRGAHFAVCLPSAVGTETKAPDNHKAAGDVRPGFVG